MHRTARNWSEIGLCDGEQENQIFCLICQFKSRKKFVYLVLLLLILDKRKMFRNFKFKMRLNFPALTEDVR